MSCRFVLALLLALPCCDAADVTLDSVTALAKTYFRDSAEVPMSVAVTTVVTDPGGKVKHRGQSTVRMVFHGYNQESGKFSLNANSGWFNTGALRDSLSGGLAAFVSGNYLVPRKDSTHTIEIQQPARPGEAVIVVVKDGECPEIELNRSCLFPIHPCGSARFTLVAGAGGDLMFQHFSLDSSGRPHTENISYLGKVLVTAFHAEVDFQKGFLPGDPKPFLWPGETVTRVSTDKGKVTITNRYSPRK